MNSQPQDSGLDWLPIATAPKDGTRIIIGWHEDDDVWQWRAAWWEAKFHSTYDHETGTESHTGDWTDNCVASFGYEEVCDYSPTHWKPAPAPPPDLRGIPKPSLFSEPPVRLLCEGCPNALLCGDIGECISEIQRSYFELMSKPPCSDCGAMTVKEASALCKCGGDRDHCHGLDLWPTGTAGARLRINQQP